MPVLCEYDDGHINCGQIVLNYEDQKAAMISFLRSFCILICTLSLTQLACKLDRAGHTDNTPEVTGPFSNIIEYDDTTATISPTSNSDNIEIDSIDKMEKSVEEQSSNLAYGKLWFGMKAGEVKRKNASRQKLATYHYNFSYGYNRNKELYAVYLHSDFVKAVVYETELQSRYTNLCRIIAEKYGKKSNCGALPSIFDVMNNHTMYLAKWHLQNKNIDLGIQYDALNAYRVVCNISQPQLEKAAKKEKYNQVNKKWIDASDNF